jgi:predicted 3-demethylubiquinone-9 3-methyltransferase (glyoxalase superfamily)
MKGITPCLWFDGQAEEAVAFYTSIFPRSRTVAVTHCTEAAAEAAGRPLGSVLMIVFELDGQRFTALNGGPEFRFNQAISLMVNCENQKEIDRYWRALSEGGQEVECGWLTDKFGLSWQIDPANLGELMPDDDPARVERVMRAVLTMRKLDIATLERAAEGR